MMHPTALVLLTAIAWGLPATAQANEANKRLVRAFYDMAFKERKPVEAAKRYLSPKYIQHNPYVGNGPEPFGTFFDGYLKRNPGATMDIKRVIAEGDLVVLHMHAKAHAGDRGKVVVDIFRVAAGKIVEHWDVTQDIPATSISSNPVY